MAESSRRSSVSGTSQNNALVVSQWQPILQSQNQIVLYNALSKSLTVGSIHPSYDTVDESDGSTCPYCLRPLDEYNHPTSQQPMGDHRAPNYFHLLAAHNESTSRPLTPPHFEDEPRPPLGSETMAEGYFDAFFREESKLGMGANGSVFLCQHVLDGNPLGRFAVKKIAVGFSHEYLVGILKEVSCSSWIILWKLHLNDDVYYSRSDCSRRSVTRISLHIITPGWNPAVSLHSVPQYPLFLF